jgi:hypothetical protein
MATPESFYPLFDTDCLREVFPWVKQLSVKRDEQGGVVLATAVLHHNRVEQPPVNVLFTFPGSKPVAVKRLIDTLVKWLPSELVTDVTDTSK